jgi:hypothetical protein
VETEQAALLASGAGAVAGEVIVVAMVCCGSLEDLPLLEMNLDGEIETECSRCGLQHPLKHYSCGCLRDVSQERKRLKNESEHESEGLVLAGATGLL